MADPITTGLAFLTTLQGAGTALSAGGTILGGISANNAAKAEAKSMEIRAGQERAASQRQAEAKRRESALIQSRAQAAAAASGGSATDQTVLDLMAGTAGEGELQAQNIQYEGAESARSLIDNANARRMAGRQALFGSFIDAGSTILGGFSTWNRGQAGLATGATKPAAPPSATGTIRKTDAAYGPYGDWPSGLQTQTQPAPLFGAPLRKRRASWWQ